MKATVRRIGTGEYFVTFPVSTQRGAVGFTVEQQGVNCWNITNQHDTEVNCWTTKKSMVDYLESQTEQQLINLAEQK